ncbi:MAG: hypothetical protein MUP45_03730 [Candidatus Marinimicrobia bacterium]|nr:hypothetical protein [Candidatus Neomarinimicrobiota bacterium]
MPNKELLWADVEHLGIWKVYIDAIEEDDGFRVSRLNSVDDEEILKNCEGKEVVIIHCGTAKPMANLKEVLEKIRGTHPEIKIGLETNTRHPAIENLVDFYIGKPISIEEFSALLKKKIATKPKT